MSYVGLFYSSRSVLQRRFNSRFFDKAPGLIKSSTVDIKNKLFEPTTIKLPSLSSTQADSSAKKDEVDWTVSYQGIGELEISAEQCAILSQPVDPQDIEVKQGDLLYMPEIKYRRILSLAFGPGKWALVPRSEYFMIGTKKVARTYALIVNSKFVSEATGEQDFFKDADMVTAFEGCKSNALMRCCKDLNIASELWDPVFIRKYKHSLKTGKPLINPRNILRPIVSKTILPSGSLMSVIKAETAEKRFVPPKVSSDVSIQTTQSVKPVEQHSVAPSKMDTLNARPVHPQNSGFTGKPSSQPIAKPISRPTSQPISRLTRQQTVPPTMRPAAQQNTVNVNNPVQQQRTFPDVTSDSQPSISFENSPLSKENHSQPAPPTMGSTPQQRPVSTVKTVIHPRTSPVQQKRYRQQGFN